MHINPADHLGAVRRGLTTVQRDGRQMRMLSAQRTYPAEVDDVWDALTSSERLPRWFLPVSGDLRVGGRFQFEGNAAGEVLACDPPRSVSITWEYGGQVSWVDVTLTPEGDGTRLTLEHVAEPPEEFWTQYGPGAVGIGWEQSLMGLALHLESGGGPIDPAEVLEWSLSEEGIAFVGGSSDGWAAASIADGQDPEGAAAAAANCLAFYTTVPDAGSDGASGTPAQG